MKKKMFFVLLAMCLTIGLLTVTALADEPEVEYNYEDYEPYTGDLNCDGVTTNSDIIILSRYLVGLIEYDKDELVYLADMDRSGNVTNADIVIMARMVVGLYDIDSMKVAFLYDDLSNARTQAIRKTFREDYDNDNTDPAHIMDITYTDYNAGGKQTTQNTQIDSAINDGVNVLVVKLVDEDSAAIVCSKAKDADIPVIFIDCNVDETVLSSYVKASLVTTNVGGRGITMGDIAADCISTYMDKVDLNKDGKITYVNFTGTTESDYLNSLCAAIECQTVLMYYGLDTELKYYDSANEYELNELTKMTEAEAYTAMKAVLASNPLTGSKPVELVFCINSDVAKGCLKALNEAGYNNGGSKMILLISGDCSSDIFELVNFGQLQGAVVDNVDNVPYETIWLIDRMSGRYCYYITQETYAYFYGYYNDSLYYL